MNEELTDEVLDRMLKTWNEGDAPSGLPMLVAELRRLRKENAEQAEIIAAFKDSAMDRNL